MATDSKILAWGTPWTEEPAWLQCTGLRKSCASTTTTALNSTVKDSFPLLNIWFQEFIINMVLYLCEEQLLQEEVIRPTLSCVP